MTGARLLAIDDLADRSHAYDTLLDVHPHRRDRYTGLVPASCVRLLGPAYALLRPEFAEVRAMLVPRRAVRSLLVSLGSADPDNRTAEVVRGFRALDADLELHVVVGALNQHRAEVAAACAGDPHLGARRRARMAHLLARVGLAVGAVGGSVWERCCLGVPQLIVSLTREHGPLPADLAAQGLICDLGAALDPAGFADALAAALAAPDELRAMAARGMELVDGLGTRRVVSALQI